MADSPEITALLRLVHRRWAIPVLAELHRLRGAKFVMLVGRLGVGRGTLTQTLDALIEAGLVVRNPGYGHPLRPEYVLTERGRSIAPACADLLAALDSLLLREVALRKWTLPVLLAIRGGARRFGEVKRSLPDVTDRALALALKQMESAGLIAREIEAGYPPAPVYALSLPAAVVLPALARVVRG
jgi:DNA-binding HxlR family transcriptional regulator